MSARIANVHLSLAQLCLKYKL